ncbi:hypothetical protein [Luteolibacter sp. LG18]|uniref:hypothetical protein n=1 Tax=Luteolibacter sp. LG18 TaxID=2819286 RepID=UPI002B303D63|nr:hypothetical protein llg_04860 [Luteolibacter sp. LG18]
MFKSGQEPGSNAWYDALEAWMRSQGEAVSDETIALHRLRIAREMNVWIGDDYRFLGQLHTRVPAEEIKRAS